MDPITYRITHKNGHNMQIWKGCKNVDTDKEREVTFYTLEAKSVRIILAQGDNVTIEEE